MKKETFIKATIVNEQIEQIDKFIYQMERVNNKALIAPTITLDCETKAGTNVNSEIDLASMPELSREITEILKRKMDEKLKEMSDL
jgi:hypothetical protein